MKKIRKQKQKKSELLFCKLFIFLFLKIFSSGLISLKDIERVQKKRSHDKESRLQTVLVSLNFVFDDNYYYT